MAEPDPQSVVRRWGAGALHAWGPWVLLAVAVGLYVALSLRLLLRLAPVWPDEALFAAPAVELLRHGRLGTPLMRDFMPGIAAHTYWVPPLYPLLAALAFLVGGPSIVTLRVLSLVIGLAVLLLTFRLTRRLGGSRWLAAIAAVVLVMTPGFLRAAQVGRMDLLLVACLLVLVDQVLAARPRPLVVGLAAALAVLTHPTGVIGIPLGLAAVVGWCRRERRLHALAWFAGGLLVPLLAYACYVARDWPGFVAQVGAQLARKGGRAPWRLTTLAATLRLAVDGLGLSAPVLAASLGGAAIGLGAAAAARRANLFVAALGVGLLGAVVVAGETWYPAYLTPLLVIGLAAGAARTWITRRWVALLLGGCMLAQLVASAGTLAARAGAGPGSGLAEYAAFCRRVSAALPAGARVMLASVPDPYFGLVGRRDLDLIEFSPVPVSPARYRRIIAGTDYVVVSPTPPAAGLAELVTEAGHLETAVAGPPGFQALVFATRRAAPPRP